MKPSQEILESKEKIDKEIDLQTALKNYKDKQIKDIDNTDAYEELIFIASSLL